MEAAGHAASDAAFRDGAPLGALPPAVSRRVGDGPAGLRRRGRGAQWHTWWFGQITRHPEVFFDSNLHTKEIHFFSGMRDFQRLPDHYADLYAQQFPHPPDGGRIGEWTPRYMFDPWVMRQLRQVAPAARIMLMLRDPVARYASAYAALWCSAPGRRIAAPGARGRARGVTRLLRPAGAARARNVSARERADPAVRTLRLDYEGQLDRTWEFLGVEPGSGRRSAPGT